MDTLVTIGNHLFRYRAAIAVAAFVPMVLFARPYNIHAAHILIFCGMAIRVWAAGYLGPGARRHGFHADHVIKNGPYRLLKHPLYLGNFFLVVGVLVMYNPPVWLSIIYTCLFVVIYTTILFSEVYYLRGKPGRKEFYRLKNLSGEVSTWIVMAVVYSIYILLVLLKKQSGL